MTLALNSTLFLKNETEFLPWESAVRNLEFFILMFDRSEVFGPMQVRVLIDFLISSDYWIHLQQTDLRGKLSSDLIFGAINILQS